MKGPLDWQTDTTVSIFDEITIWSAPFGRMLLENIPMKPSAHVLDIGFGTGFPLIELSQRFGSGSRIYGIDIWKEGVARAKHKASVLGLDNIKIFEQTATKIPLEDSSIDLICSNLGINNFDEKEKVLKETFRVLKNGGNLCLTTNPIGTFAELFILFEAVFTEMGLNNSLAELNNSINRRGSKETVKDEIIQYGYKPVKEIQDKTVFRFVDSLALLNHSLIRIGFLESWEGLIPQRERPAFFKNLQVKIDEKIRENGEFVIPVPMLYLGFEKE